MDINFLLIKHMRLHFGKPTLSTQILKSIFPVDESHTHALSRGTKHLGLDGQVCFYRRLISDAVKARGCILWPVHVWPLRGNNKTA